MERRAFERTNMELKVNFFYSKKFASGTVVNFSKNGMCIKTDTRIPCGSNVELFIIFKEGVLSITVTVVRLRFDFYNTLGVEVLNPTKKYLQFVNGLRKKK